MPAFRATASLNFKKFISLDGSFDPGLKWMIQTYGIATVLNFKLEGKHMYGVIVLNVKRSRSDKAAYIVITRTYMKAYQYTYAKKQSRAFQIIQNQSIWLRGDGEMLILP